MTNADTRFDWLADMFIEDYGVDRAVAQLQEEYEQSFDDRANRALGVLSEVRKRREEAAEASA